MPDLRCVASVAPGFGQSISRGCEVSAALNGNEGVVGGLGFVHGAAASVQLGSVLETELVVEERSGAFVLAGGVLAGHARPDDALGRALDDGGGLRVLVGEQAAQRAEDAAEHQALSRPVQLRQRGAVQLQCPGGVAVARRHSGGDGGRHAESPDRSRVGQRESLAHERQPAIGILDGERETGRGQGLDLRPRVVRRGTSSRISSAAALERAGSRSGRLIVSPLSASASPMASPDAVASCHDLRFGFGRLVIAVTPHGETIPQRPVHRARLLTALLVLRALLGPPIGRPARSRPG